MFVVLLLACESDVGLTGTNDATAPVIPMASLNGRACDPSSGLVAPGAQITAMVRGDDGVHEHIQEKLTKLLVQVHATPK